MLGKSLLPAAGGLGTAGLFVTAKFFVLKADGFITESSALVFDGKTEGLCCVGLDATELLAPVTNGFGRLGLVTGVSSLVVAETSVGLDI